MPRVSKNCSDVLVKVQMHSCKLVLNGDCAVQKGKVAKL